jgi:hypothetical protein
MSVALAAEIGIKRHHVPAIGRVLAGRRLRRVKQAQWPGTELHDLGYRPACTS